MNNRQLFSCSDINIPDSVLRTSNSTRIHNLQASNFPFMCWPNGRPCEAVNMYFLDITHTVTGDTLKTYASELRHLIRYCGSRNIGFIELSDGHIFKFFEHLQAERSLRNPSERVRNNNTIRAILSRTFLFLKWFQDNLMLPSQQMLSDVNYLGRSATINLAGLAF